MTAPETFRDQVLGTVRPLGPVMAKPAHGGTGLHFGGTMFAVLVGPSLYLRVDKAMRDEFHQKGMRALEPRPGQKLEGFYQVPQEIVDDSKALLEHAAHAAGRPMPKSAPAPKTKPAPAAPKAPIAGKGTSSGAPKAPIAGNGTKATKAAAKPKTTAAKATGAKKGAPAKPKRPTSS